METVSAKFGERLTKLLEERDQKQVDLAKYLNVAKITVSRYCRGRIPDAATLDRIAKLFEVSVDYLLGRTDDPKEQTRAPEQGEDDVVVLFRGQPAALPEHYMKLLREKLIEEAEKRGKKRPTQG